MRKLLLIGLQVSFLFCFLQWSGTSKGFIFQLEYDVLKTAATDAMKVLHPFTLIPFVGQLLLLLALFRRKPSAELEWTGIAFLAILPLLLLVIAVLSRNGRIGLSVVPVLFFIGWYAGYWKQHRLPQASSHTFK